MIKILKIGKVSNDYSLIVSMFSESISEYVYCGLSELSFWRLGHTFHTFINFDCQLLKLETKEMLCRNIAIPAATDNVTHLYPEFPYIKHL